MRRWLRDGRLPGWILMVVGAVLWLAGELIGVHSRRANDTTSEWVWWLQRRRFVGPLVKGLVGAFVVSLFFHFWTGWSLVP